MSYPTVSLQLTFPPPLFSPSAHYLACLLLQGVHQSGISENAKTTSGAWYFKKKHQVLGNYWYEQCWVTRGRDCYDQTEKQWTTLPWWWELLASSSSPLSSALQHSCSPACYLRLALTRCDLWTRCSKIHNRCRTCRVRITLKKFQVSSCFCLKPFQIWN